MKKLLILTALIVAAATAQGAEVSLFITGGQSNTDGRLNADTRPAYLLTANTRCMASCHQPYTESRLGQFTAYQPASGAAGQPARWAYDAVTYYYLAEALGQTFYVAKTSYGGTSIDPSVNNSPSSHPNQWLSGYGSGYHWSADPTFLAATAIAETTFQKEGTTYDGQSLLKAWTANIDAAIDAITAAGNTPSVKAVIWHQGESDRNAAAAYHDNLRQMVAHLRSHLVAKTGNAAYATLPFFCGTVPQKSAQYNATVEKALYQIEDEDADFHVVDLRDLTLQSDNLHFDAAGAELFGKRLYNRMVDEHVVSGTRLDDVEYARVDHSDFGGDEYVGAARTWTFESFTSDLVTEVTPFESLYLHSNNMNGRRFLSAATTAGSVTFADGTVQNVTRTLTTATGANGWTAGSITDSYNASQHFQVAVAANTLYAGRYSMMVSAPSAKADSPTTMQLIFNGKVVAEKAFTASSEIYELKYDAAQAGTFFMHTTDRCMMYAVRYVPTVDRTGQRTVTTDADGYATFGNLADANLALPAGLTAWAVTPSDGNAGHVVLTALSGVDKGAAVLLKGAAATQYELPFAWTPTGYDGQNAMTAQLTAGNVEEQSGGDFVNYIFANGQFAKANGTVSLEAGRAYLSLSNGVAQCSHTTLTIADGGDEPEPEPEPEPTAAVTYDFVDVYVLFADDETVWQETTWLCQDFGFPSKYDPFDAAAATGSKDGVYWTHGGSSNRSWKSGTQGAGTYSFADGTPVTVTKTARSSGSSSLPAPTASQTASAAVSCDFAVNAAVPGKFSVMKSGNATGHLYFNGTKVAELTTTSDGDMRELSYTAPTAGTFVYVCNGTSNVAAMRFVPTAKNSVYTSVPATGWAAIALPYAAVVPEDCMVCYVTGYEDSAGTGTVTLTAVAAGDVIPAKAGFLFNGAKGLYRLGETESDATWTANKLAGTADAALTGYDSSTATDAIYVLGQLDDDSAVGFTAFSGTTIDRYKAYLPMDTKPQARSFRFSFDDGTAVAPLTAENFGSRAVFSLSGTQRRSLSRGLNILKHADGTFRKVMVR